MKPFSHSLRLFILLNLSLFLFLFFSLIALSLHCSSPPFVVPPTLLTWPEEASYCTCWWFAIANWSRCQRVSLTWFPLSYGNLKHLMLAQKRRKKGRHKEMAKEELRGNGETRVNYCECPGFPVWKAFLHNSITVYRTFSGRQKEVVTYEIYYLLNNIGSRDIDTWFLHRLKSSSGKY